jgi:hypothetical protein
MLPLIFNETRRRWLASVWLRSGAWLAGALACGSGADSPARDDHAGHAGPASAPAMSSAPSAAARSSDAPPDTAPANAAAISAAVSMAGDSLRAACGSSIDVCSATPGCNEILACAARAACTGTDCYCSDARCQVEGPCRAVIAAAPGARVPDAANPSPGPAAEAAGRVGACLQGLAGGVPGLPAAPSGSAPDAGFDAG